jgi:hypothetical protein
MWQKLRADGRLRRIAIALGIYALCTVVYFAFAAKQTRIAHTPFNHFALLAEAWLKGQLDLGAPPPGYAQNNDFAQFNGKWFIVFPPFPAMLLLPLVKFAGSAVKVQDGQFFIWLAGIAPAVLFLVMEKLRRMGMTARGTQASVIFSLLFAFGTVYFFTAEQGTVWFAAHVVGAALAALYLLFALDAERPALAGLMLGLGFLTRAPLIYAVPIFLFEALRVSAKHAVDEPPKRIEGFKDLRDRLVAFYRALDKKKLATLLAAFAVPIVLVLAFTFWHNKQRFGDPFEFGYRHLTVLWKPRMEKWGLVSYHYLGRNLSVMLTSLPYMTKPPTTVPFQINTHGLALWVTTPLYLWLLWPRKWTRLHLPLLLTALAVAVPSLLYQNSGWVQFGYRFSLDYAVFLFALFAIGGYRMSILFWIAALWSVLVNGFGARSFQRPEFSAYYFQEGSQAVIHQPD